MIVFLEVHFPLSVLLLYANETGENVMYWRNLLSNGIKVSDKVSRSNASKIGNTKF